MEIDNIQDLKSQTVSLRLITAVKSYWPAGGAICDYRSGGRPGNLLHIVTRGCMIHHFDKQTIMAGPGTVLFIPEGTRYCAQNEKDCEGVGTTFRFCGALTVKHGIYCNRQDDGEYLRLFELLNESHLMNPKAYLHEQALIMRILDKFTGSFDVHIHQLIMPAVQYLLEHYRENDPVSLYADVCSLSESYFRSIFVKNMGMTPTQYRNLLRFKEACRLRCLHYDMEEIAERVGFCSAAYLRKLFRKAMGCSMGEYIKSGFVI